MHSRWDGYEILDRSRSFPKRWILTLLGFLGFLNVYAMRVNLSVAMVAMVMSPHVPDTPGSPSVACQELLNRPPEGNNSAEQSYEKNSGEFDWDASTQALILGAFFYGYVVTQIPGGIIAEKFGAKWLYAIGVLVTSVFTVFTPLAAYMGVWPLVAVRAIEGLFEGVTFPAMNALIGRWAPKLERSRMASIIYTGATAGSVISFGLSGIISATMGWPWVFYIFGVLGFLWSMLWLALVYDSPEDHPYITKEELVHIRRGQDETPRRDTPIPWKSILTSHYVWALVATHFGQNWGFYTILTELPTYLSNILHFNLKNNGILSAFPYLIMAIMAVVGSFCADKMRSSGRFRINTIRKTFNSLAFFMPALCVFIIAYIGCEPLYIIALLTFSMGFNGLSHSGYNITHVDMSPEFAGTLMGITNCIANFAGFLAPAYVGVVIQGGQTIANWRIVFLTASAVMISTGMIYNLFCTAEPQPWGSNEPPAQTSGEGRGENMTSPILPRPR